MISFQNEFQGKRVIVTGACGIFGRWIAEAFAKAGAELCLSDRRDDDLGKLKEEFEARFEGTPVLPHATELTDDASIQSFVDCIRDAWGAPDILVNNAGIYPSGFLLDIDSADWDRIMSVNLRAPYVLTRDFAKLMIQEGRPGSIINISSGASGKMRRTAVPYCVSKTALDRLTKGFALELAEFNIRVNAVEPGFAAGSEVTDLTDEHIRNVTSAIPLGRQSNPEDAAHAVLYLCSENAGFITGATLAVDGGNSVGSMAVYQDKKNPL